MGAFFGRDPVLRGQSLATRESGIGPDFGQSPYLLHTFPPIHTKLVPQPHQSVLAVHHVSVESYLLMCANTDIPLIMFINCGRVPYERFFSNGINKSSSWTYQSYGMINKCHICSEWPSQSGNTLHLLHFKCSPRQFNEPQNIFLTTLTISF